MPACVTVTLYPLIVTQHMSPYHTSQTALRRHTVTLGHTHRHTHLLILTMGQFPHDLHLPIPTITMETYSYQE